MPVYRVTFSWNQGTLGVGETYWTPSINDNTSLRDAISNFLFKRSQIMWTYQFVVGIRIAVEGGVRQSTFFPPGAYRWPTKQQSLTVPPAGVIVGDGRDTRAEQVRAPLQMRMLFGALRKSTRYLSSVPDRITGHETGGVDVGGNPAWYTAFIAFRDFLTGDNPATVGAWQIKGRTDTTADPPDDVTGVVLQAAAPGLLGVAVGGGAPAAFVVGQKVSWSGVREKVKTAVSYNGRYFVDSINTTLRPGETVYFLRGTSGGDPTNIKLMGQLRAYRTTLLPITDAVLVRVGIHKRGKPSPSPAGRRKTRVSRDP